MPIIKNNRLFPFWLITIAVTAGLTLPVLIQDGMFMDAVLYTSVSHNLSQGIGSFWFPQFSVHNIAGTHFFAEQPPLVSGIQSVFFTVLGSSIYVERFYTLVILVLTSALIVAVWKELFADDPVKRKYGWLPLLLWITVPVCFWSYSNNMHENTMGIFTITAVLLILKAYNKEKHRLLFLIFAGVSVFMAVFSKGIPGLFPVTVPFLYWIFIRKTGFLQMIFHSIIVLFTPLIIFGLFLLNTEARDSFSVYFFDRALHRINDVPTADSRFFILGRLIQELAGQIALVLLFLGLGRFKKLNIKDAGLFRYAFFFILIGLAGSAPLMLTMVQKGFYFVPSLPFFAIGLSLFAIPVVSQLTEKLKPASGTFRALMISGIILVTGALTLTVVNAGKTSRDRELLHDIYLIGKVVPQNSMVSVTDEMWPDFAMQSYLIRHFNISVETSDTNRFAIVDTRVKNLLEEKYIKVNIPTVTYNLYLRKKNPVQVSERN